MTGELFARLVDVLLPEGGCVLTLVEAYFDESIGPKGTPILCVAGYLIESGQAKLLSEEWRTALDEARLPYFRMSECAHGNGAFASLDRPHRILVQSAVMRIIEHRTIQGLAVTVNIAEFERYMPDHPLIGSPYTFCAHVIIGGVQNWIRKTRYAGEIAYFFEAGHASQSEANGIMQKIFKQPDLRDASRYHRHSFVLKEQTPAVQAADLLAWQWYTDLRHRIEGRPRRRDCERLLKHPHVAVHVGPDMILELANKWGFEPSEEESLVTLHLGDRR